MCRRTLTPAFATTLAILLACIEPGCSSQPPSGSAAPKGKFVTGTPVKVNLDEIFPPGAGRDLVLNNCTTCHTFVPIVVLQLTREAWERNQRIHRERVPGMTDGDFKTLYEYLIANFNPDRPVPKLPKALLDTWTSY